jgi:hypothetical protein
MSHFLTIRTQIREREQLLQALCELGYQHVESHEVAQRLFGYQGDVRPESAEVIIRRTHIGSASNDVGFKQQESGEFTAIISEFDRSQKFSTDWLKELNRRYSYNVIHAQAREQNLIVEEEQKLPNGDVVIILSERG